MCHVHVHVHVMSTACWQETCDVCCVEHMCEGTCVVCDVEAGGGDEICV